ncbi:hypothetical protein ACB092_05G288900 [Castanea dentata]
MEELDMKAVSTMSDELNLKHKLYELKMTEGADLASNIKFDDENKAMMLLSSLLASHEHLVATLHWGKETLEFEEISGPLLDHYQRKQNSSENSGEGLMVKGNQDRRRKKDRDHSSTRKCQKKGHIKRDCPEWKRGKDTTKEGLSRYANVVVVDSNSNSIGDMLSISFSANRLVILGFWIQHVLST